MHIFFQSLYYIFFWEDQTKIINKIANRPS